MGKMTENGCSTCKAAGTEKHETFVLRVGGVTRRMVQYDYRHTDGSRTRPANLGFIRCGKSLTAFLTACCEGCLTRIGPCLMRSASGDCRPKLSIGGRLWRWNGPRLQPRGHISYCRTIESNNHTRPQCTIH